MEFYESIHLIEWVLLFRCYPLLQSWKSNRLLYIQSQFLSFSLGNSLVLSFYYLLGMRLQQNVRRNWPARLLEWCSSNLQLPCLLQAMVFHFWRERMLLSSCD